MRKFSKSLDDGVKWDENDQFGMEVRPLIRSPSSDHIKIHTAAFQSLMHQWQIDFMLL